MIALNSAVGIFLVFSLFLGIDFALFIVAIWLVAMASWVKAYFSSIKQADDAFGGLSSSRFELHVTEDGIE